MKAPAECASMADVRVAIDALDRDLVEAFAKRFSYIDRAAELKLQAGLSARIPERIEQVVQNVRAHANERGLDPDLVEKLWRELIEASIVREENMMGHQ